MLGGGRLFRFLKAKVGILGLSMICLGSNATSRAMYAAQEGQVHAKGTTGPEAPSGRDRQRSSHREDRDRRRARDDIEATSEAQERLGGGESACGKHNTRGPQGDCSKGSSGEVGVMGISAFDAANHLAKISNHTVSNLKFHKILYMADMNFVGQNGQRLISEDFEAWDYGPVLNSLYHTCKAFGSKPVPNVFWGAKDISGTPEAEMIELAWSKLKSATAGQLVETTHSKLGAWVLKYVPGAKQIKISTNEMIEEYVRRTGQRTA